ncbi:MAG: VOC family protein [Methanomicrobiales archaeon]|nr:VOC family protein [Methanomicrobiales archaeon]
MANLAYFEIPADNVGRAKKFYTSLLGWTIGPTSMPTSMPATMEYQDVKTGEPKEGTLAMGGMYKRQVPGTPLTVYAMVEGFDKVVGKVEKLGGKILMPRMEVEGVGFTAVIQDTEGNVIGLWEPMMG